jgi:hypothetical protein
MKLSEKLLTLANWLADEPNELLIAAEGDETCLNIVAEALIKAADALQTAASEVSEIEPEVESVITPEALEEMAAIAQAFDESGDELLKKQASVLDEILLTFATPKGLIYKLKQAEDDRIEQLKKKYKEVKPQHDEINKVSDALQDIEKSPVYKQYRILEAPLSTRTCPDHPGALVARVGEHTWQCQLDKKVYNYDSGFTTMQGNKVPGGSVDQQTPNYHDMGHMIFDTRESKLGV